MSSIANSGILLDAINVDFTLGDYASHFSSTSIDDDDNAQYYVSLPTIDLPHSMQNAFDAFRKETRSAQFPSIELNST